MGNRNQNKLFNRRGFKYLLYCLAIMSLNNLGFAQVKKSIVAEEHSKTNMFPPADVRILSGPFKQAMDANRTYILALNVDRLLAPFRQEAGLPEKAKRYGDWESQGLGGQTAGHYLSALSYMYASTGDAEMKRRLDYMITELATCQQQFGNGYVGAVIGSKDFWPKIASGNVDLIKQRWVPFYNIHKTMAGLYDAYLIGKNAQALDMFLKMCNWCGDLVSNLSNKQIQEMLKIEHGGMNEVLANAYSITGEEKYLLLAKRFSHQELLLPLENKQDKLQGLHANTQIPKVIGFERISQLGNDKDYHTAANFFWETVTQNRTVAFGGNSVDEYFKTFKDMLESRSGPETCNSYNMLKLTKQLFKDKPNATYADYYERTLYNHILSSINIENPGYVYLTSIRPGHYRVYSAPGEEFWCCVGTGMESPGRYGDFIYANDGNEGLYVNLFISSTVKWEKNGLMLTQETSFPEKEETKLTLALKKNATFPLYIRYPAWVKPGTLQITINGKPKLINTNPSNYVKLVQPWKNGDIIKVKLPMNIHLEALPEADVADNVALLYGPIVLAAAIDTTKMDNVFPPGKHRLTTQRASGPAYPLSKIPVLIGSEDDIVTNIKPVKNKPLTFTVGNSAYPSKWSQQELIPFYKLHNSRYLLYWKVTTPEKQDSLMVYLKEKDRLEAALERRTIDQLAAGEQQPEADHNYVGEMAKTGTFRDRRWRSGRSVSFDLKVLKGISNQLQIVVESGTNTSFDILMNDIKLTDPVLSTSDGKGFTTKIFSIPKDVVKSAKNSVVTIKFISQNTMQTAKVFELRTLKADKDPALKNDI